MTVVAAAFCPHPPLLVPAIGAGEAVEVRRFAVDATRWLTTQGIDRVIALGADTHAACFAPGTVGSFEGYGVDYRVRLPGAAEHNGAVLPPPLAVAAWLLDEAGWSRSVLAVTCDGAGALAVLEGSADWRDGLLVMGDGSARRSEKAPGWIDERAAGFDAATAAALAGGEPGELAVDLALGAELLAAGAPAWTAAARLLSGCHWDADLSYDAAPYGVGYFVATWSAR